MEKHIVYKKEGAVYSKVLEKLYSYDSLKYTPGDMASINNHVFNAAKTVRGLKVSHNDYYTYYDIYSGYNLPSKTITKQYNDSGILITNSTQNYATDSYGIITHYIPISSEGTDSNGNVNKTETEFVFNKTNKTSAETELETANALYLPLKTKSYKNNVLLSLSRLYLYFCPKVL